MKAIGLGIAGVGVFAAIGLLKWHFLSGNKALWAIGVGALLFVASTPAQAQ